MKLNYYPDTDSLYIDLSARPSAESREVSEGVVLDYDDEGNLVTSTLADYLVPSAADLPSYVTDRTESRAANALGVKGVGEAGTIASTPAVVNAIVDALRPLGINDVEMPCTPERVWRAIQDARGGEQASAAEQHEARQSDQTQGHSPQGIGTPDQSGGVA